MPSKYARCAKFFTAKLIIGNNSNLPYFTSNRLVEIYLFWSSGLSPYLAASTKLQFFPGSNQLGAVLEDIRHAVMGEAVRSKMLGVEEDMSGPKPLVK